MNNDNMMKRDDSNKMLEEKKDQNEINIDSISVEEISMVLQKKIKDLERNQTHFEKNNQQVIL